MRALIISCSLFLLVGCGDSESDDEPAAIGCEASTEYTTLVHCSQQWTNCADQREYSVECNGSAGTWVCTCWIDGAVTTTANSTDFCEAAPVDRSVLSNPLCGWKLK